MKGTCVEMLPANQKSFFNAGPQTAFHDTAFVDKVVPKIAP